MSTNVAPPTVSVILPTYNRAAFLPQAFAAIREQRLTDWELVVVNDGSTDNTAELAEKFAAQIEQSVRYVAQENAGAYGARNTGLDLATGRYIAFYDSDDRWLPHHLTDCVAAMEANADVDWVYGACRRVELATGREIAPSSFYEDGRPRPFLALEKRVVDLLNIIEDHEVVRCMLLWGLYCGLQNSVLRRCVFDGRRFQTEYRNEAEDQLFVVRALAAGHKIGYLDNVHVQYHLHTENSSAASSDQSIERRLPVLEALARGFEDLRHQAPLTRSQSRALDRRLGREYFWVLGYATLWQNGRQSEAMQMFRRGIRLWPWDVKSWKTYLLAKLGLNRAETVQSKATA